MGVGDGGSDDRGFRRDVAGGFRITQGLLFRHYYDGYAALGRALAIGVGNALADNGGSNRLADCLGQDSGAFVGPVHVVVVNSFGYFNDRVVRSTRGAGPGDNDVRQVQFVALFVGNGACFGGGFHKAIKGCVLRDVDAVQNFGALDTQVSAYDTAAMPNDTSFISPNPPNGHGWTA